MMAVIRYGKKLPKKYEEKIIPASNPPVNQVGQFMQVYAVMNGDKRTLWVGRPPQGADAFLEGFIKVS